MKKIFFCLAILLSQWPSLQAQTLNNIHFDVATGLSSSVKTASFAVWKPLHPSSENTQKWQFSYGIRSSFFRKTDTDFITASSRLTSDAFGPHVIFLPTIEENLDTLFISRSSVLSVNLAFSIQRTITKNLGAGFNIDIVGFSVGSAQDAVFNPNNGTTRAIPTSVKPARWNLLIASDSDFGSLNSEFFISWKIPSRVAFRTGMNFNFTEFKTAEELQPDNKRFRSKTALPFISIQLPLGE
jgi:hypothetical protein